jgi:hypothetical protein
MVAFVTNEANWAFEINGKIPSSLPGKHAAGDLAAVHLPERTEAKADIFRAAG